MDSNSSICRTPGTEPGLSKAGICDSTSSALLYLTSCPIEATAPRLIGGEMPAPANRYREERWNQSGHRANMTTRQPAVQHELAGLSVQQVHLKDPTRQLVVAVLPNLFGEPEILLPPPASACAF